MHVLPQFTKEQKSKALEYLIGKWWGKPIIRAGGFFYLAGRSIDKGWEKVRAYEKLGRYSAVDILGEASKNLEDALRYRHVFKEIIGRASAEFPGRDVVTVSVKLSNICAVNEDKTQILPQTPAEQGLEEIVEYASKKDIRVELDMEDHNFTDVTIKAAQYCWNKGYKNLKVMAMQTMLHRTDQDIRDVFVNANYPIPKDNVGVRVVRGIYSEPPDIAMQDKEEAKARIPETVANLLDAGVYVAIGTHEPDIVRRIVKEVIEPRLIAGTLTKDRFEFQFLKGVQHAYDLEKELMQAGYKVRYYMPIEIKKGDGDQYIKRRLVNNPEVADAFVRNLGQMVVSRVLPNRRAA